MAYSGWFRSAHGSPMRLREFNRLTCDVAAQVLRPCLNVDRWAHTILGSRPYSHLEDLLEVARDAAYPLTAAELEAALAHQVTPRLIPTARVKGAAAEASIRQQLDTGVHTYQERFGRPFLIRTTGRTPTQILAQLWERLGNDLDTEDRVLAQQLRQIALLELTARVSA